MTEHYYKQEHLGAFASIAEGSPDLAKKFFDYYNAVFAAGALTEREKALIALAVALTVQCPYRRRDGDLIVVPNAQEHDVRPVASLHTRLHSSNAPPQHRLG